MGSLSDLLLAPQNGHDIGEADVARVNEALVDLRGRAYALARALLLEHDAR